jgi:5-methylcytosine-specific restriction enzyme subunit McrC
LKPIIKYEHEILRLNEQFKRKHLDALIQLNALHEGNYFDIIPNGVRFKHYAGVIQVEGLCIEILPKADRADENSKWRDVLTDMLKACGKIKIHTSADANLSRSRLNLLELYFDQFLTEVEILQRNGLAKQYRKEAGNVKALKGKLDFAQNIRHNLVHKERFYTIHQVYDVDHKIHQVLAQAIDIVRLFSTSMWVHDKCRRVQLAFPEVQKINASKQLLDSIQLNRKTAPYTRALELARLIILNYSPDISQGKDKMISILFNMNQLWEEYVLLHLRKAANNFSDIQILGKKRKPFWNDNRLEPDIVLKKGNETYIIDTKWKTPGKSTSVEDLRQMYTYSRFWNAKRIMLLYPGKHGTTASIPFENFEHLQSHDGITYSMERHECMKGFVSVLKPEGDKNQLDDTLGEKILAIFLLN